MPRGRETGPANRKRLPPSRLAFRPPLGPSRRGPLQSDASTTKDCGLVIRQNTRDAYLPYRCPPSPPSCGLASQCEAGMSGWAAMRAVEWSRWRRTSMRLASREDETNSTLSAGTPPCMRIERHSATRSYQCVGSLRLAAAGRPSLGWDRGSEAAGGFGVRPGVHAWAVSSHFSLPLHPRRSHVRKTTYWVQTPPPPRGEMALGQSPFEPHDNPPRPACGKRRLTCPLKRASATPRALGCGHDVSSACVAQIPKFHLSRFPSSQPAAALRLRGRLLGHCPGSRSWLMDVAEKTLYSPLVLSRLGKRKLALPENGKADR